MTRTLIFLCTLLLLQTCQSGDAPSEGAAPIQEGPTTRDTTDVATTQAPLQTKQDTLMLEGMAEPIELRLYQSPAGAALPFYTYLPPRIEATAGTSAKEDSLHFRLGEARLTYVVLPEGVRRSVAQAQAHAFFGRANVQSCQSTYPWQWECLYSANTPQRIRRVLIGEQQGRQFLFLLDYPAEYGDGFGPRYAMILREWTFLP